MTSAFIDIGGVKLHYEVAGRGQPLVFVHGNGVDMSMWDEQFEEFAKSFRVIRFDLRDHGKSDSHVGPFSLAADLHGLLRALDVNKAHVVGFSLGVSVALDFALEHPEVVDRLVLIDGAPGGLVMGTDFFRRFVEYVGVAHQAGLGETYRRWLQDPLFAHASRNPALKSRLEDMVGKCSGGLFLRPQNAQSTLPPAHERLAEIGAKCLLLVGEYDDDFSSAVDQMSVAFPNARKVVIPGAGHMSTMENPAATNRAILDFLAEA
jgi:3-oxoadipate enol-lactonase